MANSNKIIVPQAVTAINRMKYEIASEMGLADYKNMDKGNLTARQNGQIGGEITKRLVQAGQQALSGMK